MPARWPHRPTTFAAIPIRARKPSARPPPDAFAGQWESSTNPCLTEARYRESQSQQGARQLAKTRARVLLQSAQPRQAFEALREAYAVGLPEDGDLEQLSSSASSQWAKDVTQSLSQHGDLSEGLRATAPGCVFSEQQTPHRGALAALRYAFGGVDRVYAACVVPEGDVTLPEGHEQRLVLRRRVGPGRFVVVDSRTLSSEDTSDIKRASFALPTIHEPAAYYDVALVTIKQGHAPTIVQRAGFFWFEGL